MKDHDSKTARQSKNGEKGTATC
jgi:hypothetical protein